MKKKISLVSYYNALPYRYGLQSNNKVNALFEISYDTPAECSNKIIRGDADIGLLPVASLFDIREHLKWQGNFGIASEGKVESVLLLSNQEVSECKEIFLDTESRTSVRLLKLLAREFWKIDVVYHDLNDPKNDGSGFQLLIGDKALQQRTAFKFTYDLSEYWKLLTGLPFVFARWVSTAELSPEEISILEDSFEEGLKQRVKIASEVALEGIEAAYYLNSCIRYRLEKKEIDGLNLFYSKLSGSDTPAV